MPFEDTPDMKQVEATINSWHRPELLNRWKYLAPNLDMVELAHQVSQGLAEIQSAGYRSRLEVRLTGWLYDFIRANVKRGRVFDLGQVLLQGRADCVGYAKLFTVLGRLFGLDVGVIEVVVDNAGRYVPHTAVLVRLENGRWRFIDLWYGSKNIRHQRVGLQARRGGIWQIEDLDLKELRSREEVCYLPDHCVDAITLYIRGNRHLDGQEYAAAISCYSKAIGLYPGNARFYYNRAIAYDNLWEHERARADYAHALSDDAAMIRILATEHDEVISLFDLDAKGIDSLAQEVYLLYYGFATGRRVPLQTVARRLGLSQAETEAILSSVEAKLAIGSD
ncbi:MAG: tetratricopeptide repeat protein [Dehalococcoidia bacterium]|nr:tetratricopeptide repeat protein [Dehalococcoidia bacterium]